MFDNFVLCDQANSSMYFKTIFFQSAKARAVLAEPLLHFALLAALIFGAQALRNPGSGAISRDIVVSPSDVERLRALAIKQFGVAPDQEQLRNLVRAQVREEVLYREALDNGLDRDDAVVRRRLVQKWEFLAQSDVRLPSDNEVLAYYLAHPQRYQLPPRMEFEHVLFKAGPGVAERAAAALKALSVGQNVSGEPSMLARRQTMMSQNEVARDFGAPFAGTLFAAQAGQWHGPIASILGLHLVRIVARQNGQREPFDAVRERVRADAGNARLQQARETAYAQARQRYRIRLPQEAQ